MSQAVESAIQELLEKMGEQEKEEYIEGAIDMLTDDDLVSFQIVAVREVDDGLQRGFQRFIDPNFHIRHNIDGEECVSILSEQMETVYENEVKRGGHNGC